MMRPILPAILMFAALFGPVTATEAQIFDLAVSSAGTGGGTVTSSPAGVDCGTTCTATFSGSTVVTLSAAPNAASVFAGWSGACSGLSTCVVTMDAAKSVTATFGSITYTIFHSFTGTPDGAAPIASLIQATDGLFYGTTSEGGANSCGTVFATDGSSTPAILHSFTGAEGCSPAAALLQASDGLFYGLAGHGGANNAGTLFRMNSIGQVTVLHDFGDPLVEYRRGGSVLRAHSGQRWLLLWHHCSRWRLRLGHCVQDARHRGVRGASLVRRQHLRVRPAFR